MPPDLQIRVGSAHVDQAWLIRTLKASYWGGHYTEGKIITAMHRSLCFSAWSGDEQVGFARILTDGAITSVLNDVIVDEKWRRQGIGRKMLESVFAYHLVKRTICICQARPENFQLYQKFSFVPVANFLKRDPQ